MHQPCARCSEKVGHCKAERLEPRHENIREVCRLSLDECITHTRQLVNIFVMTVTAMVFSILTTTVIMTYRLHAATFFIIGIIIKRRRKLRYAHIARVVALHESNSTTHQYNEQRKQYAIKYDANFFHLIYIICIGSLKLTTNSYATFILKSIKTYHYHQDLPLSPHH